MAEKITRMDLRATPDQKKLARALAKKRGYPSATSMILRLLEEERIRRGMTSDEISALLMHEGNRASKKKA